ncbi:2-C-methyl-D-erythritol 4-phosphate cytidylyltransferase [Sulfitobacter noctilucicola]|uniref:2-C-methyl-D-erythritol 4-phosphate cytidylyltransferase n=1 Tax=Sulfitobacter noctilucicola TaxID=1342301 RepID=A0A7W6Q4F8_9RHOB|nr:2-C-methyl-D-erythritol 4-phosphate cytidylyltransferase [Sulfitobacter noctilucicola]KIN63869.1 2-C-methyl-D-erythritol 4-phosphate cytidylyltransferase [Sulfitobacter noctilucicola]MBB4174623.1 2-C-methyl-D-erythritol 4-phosphate cytidylyltransferase [Sulfitobacter noctilucicola]
MYKSDCTVLIVAAGRGRRFGDPLPKQYLPIAGTCSLRRCLDTFLGVAEIDRVQVVIHPDDAKLYAEAVAGLTDARLMPSVAGGDTRAASVVNGLQALQLHNPDKVLVHDAARPFISPKVIGGVLTELDTCDAAFAAVQVVDALWKAEGSLVSAPVSRDNLWRAQTPQGFRFDALLRAHLAYDGDAADDVEIARSQGISVKIVQGDTANFKVTTPDDLARAENFVRAQQP